MEPNTLQDAIVYFASPDNCREYLVAHRWPDGVICPRCDGKKVLFQPKYNRWQCGSKHPLRQFTSKTGTIFEDSPLGLDKWLLAMRSEEHTSELQSLRHLVCRLLLEKKKKQ